MWLKKVLISAIVSAAVVLMGSGCGEESVRFDTSNPAGTYIGSYAVGTNSLNMRLELYADRNWKGTGDFSGVPTDTTVGTYTFTTSTVTLKEKNKPDEIWQWNGSQMSLIDNTGFSIVLKRQ